METADLVLNIDGKLHSAHAMGTIDYIHTVEPGASSARQCAAIAVDFWPLRSS